MLGNRITTRFRDAAIVNILVDEETVQTYICTCVLTMWYQKH